MKLEESTLAENYQSLDECSNSAIEHGQVLGADEIQVSTSYDHEVRLVIENGAFSSANSLETQGIYMGIHKNQKKGSTTTNSTDEAIIKDSVRTAVDISKYTLPDENLNYVGLEQAPPCQSHDFLYDSRLCDSTLADLKGYMQEALKCLTADKRLCLDRFELSHNISRSSLANSHGVKQTEKQTMVSWTFFALAKDGEQVSGFDYDSGFTFSLQNLEQNLLADAKNFSQRVLANLNPIKCPSYKGLVIISPRALEDLWLSLMMFHISGRQVMDGKSRWIDKVGKKVMDSNITIIDDPNDPKIMGATSFDSDGVGTSKKEIIKNGILSQHYHDTYSAKKTGSAINGVAGGPFGLKVAPGDIPFTQLTQQEKPILLVDRFSGNTDPISGDFSGVAKNSTLFENGQNLGPVKETMIAGNFFSLCNEIAAISQEQESIEGRFLSPYLMFDNINVS